MFVFICLHTFHVVTCEDLPPSVVVSRYYLYLSFCLLLGEKTWLVFGEKRWGEGVCGGNWVEIGGVEEVVGEGQWWLSVEQFFGRFLLISGDLAAG